MTAFRASFALLFIGTSMAHASIENRVNKATGVVEHRMESASPIPQYVVDVTRCVASLRVVKAGLGWGGQGSAGMVSCRTPSGWSAPSFFNVSGVNFGLQIGVQFLETVLMIITEHGKSVITHPTFQLGADLSFAAGPVGTGGGTGAIPAAHVLSYQRAKGLYVGATINGFILSHNKRVNQEAYGEDLGIGEILGTPGMDAPAVTLPFVDVLEEHFH